MSLVDAKLFFLTFSLCYKSLKRPLDISADIYSYFSSKIASCSEVSMSIIEIASYACLLAKDNYSLAKSLLQRISFWDPPCHIFFHQEL